MSADAPMNIKRKSGRRDNPSAKLFTAPSTYSNERLYAEIYCGHLTCRGDKLDWVRLRQMLQRTMIRFVHHAKI